MHVTYITRGYIIMSESFFYSVKDLSKDLTKIGGGIIKSTECMLG